MNADDAKVQRTTAKRLFTMSYNQFKLSIDEKYEQSIVQGRFGDLKEAWGTVMSKNAIYLALKYPNDEDMSPEDEEWINAPAKTYNTAERSLNDHEQTATQVKPDEAKHAYKLLDFEKSQLEIAVQTLNTVTAHEDATPKSINEAHREMKHQLKTYKDAHRDHIHRFGDIDERYTTMLGKMQNLCVTTSIKAEKSIQQKKEDQDDENGPLT